MERHKWQRTRACQTSSRPRLASREVRDVDIQASPIDDEMHGRELLYVIVRDVTARNQPEAGAHKAREFLTATSFSRRLLWPL